VSDDEFRALVNALRSGSEEAGWQLVERYGDRIRRAVRRALDPRLRPKFDSMDFVQLAWLSFFRRPEYLDRFDNPGQLAQFLVQMAMNKLREEARRRLRLQKYGVRRERNVDNLSTEDREGLRARGPSPVDVAAAREQWQRIVDTQPQRYREIVEMRLQGFTFVEIAESLGIAESTARRAISKLVRRFAA